jgi:hypothetical protein
MAGAWLYASKGEMPISRLFAAGTVIDACCRVAV